MFLSNELALIRVWIVTIYLLKMEMNLSSQSEAQLIYQAGSSWIDSAVPRIRRPVIRLIQFFNLSLSLADDKY